MIRFIQLFIFITLSLSFCASAQSGYEYSQPVSNLNHLAWFIPVFIVAIYGIKFLLKELGFDHRD